MATLSEDEFVFVPPDIEELGEILSEDYFDNEEYPFVAKGHKYALDIVNGEIVSGIYIKQAAKRYLTDLLRAKDKDNSFFYAPERAEKFLRLGQRFKHVKGNWDNDYIIFEGWQCFMGSNIFGFIDRDTDSRRYRSAHVEVARGNAKSTIASIFALYFLCLENPNGNEVYSAATKKDQARIILDASRAMARKNKQYRDRMGVEVLAHQIVHRDSDSFFRALSSEGDSLDGLIPVLAVIDELHAHKTREVFDVIDSAMSKRNDSLMFSITTAGFNTQGIGHSESKYAKKLLKGETKNDNFFALVYTLDEKDNAFEESNWIKANPNLGVSVDLKNLRAKAQKAQDDPESENNFLVKHLNIWTDAKNPFFNMKKWEIIKGMAQPLISDFRGEDCMVAIDLASSIDLTSECWIFRRKENDVDNFYMFWENFIPEARLIDKNRNRDLYNMWAKQGWLTATPGESINYIKLQEQFLEKKRWYSIQECMFDPWNAKEFAQRMIAEGVNMVEYRQSVGNFSEPMKRLGALILELQIRHQGCPLVQWAMGNVVAKMDANDNVFPRKEHFELKIDPAVAAIMAMGGWVRKIQQESVYKKRGIVVL